MSNLKSITELPLAESAEGLNLIVNDGGAAKQIPASAVGAQADWNEADENSPSFIQNKPTKLGGYNRELVYEKSFAVEDEVYDLAENFDDMSIFFEDGAEMAAEVELYAYNQDENTCLSDSFGRMRLTQNGRCVNITFFEMIDNSYAPCDVIDLYDPIDPYYEFGTDNGRCYISGAPGIMLCNRVKIDENLGAFTACDDGGMLLMDVADSCSIKSVKLYKITY